MNRKRFLRWIGVSALVITLLFGLLVMPTLVRKSRLISHVNEGDGFFYSYHSPVVRKVLGKHRYKLKAILVPKMEPLLGRHWPGIFKEITDVRIENSDWDLGVLRHQNDIHWLDIGSLEVESKEINVLKTLPALDSLRINVTNLDADGIATIATFEQVKRLSLTGRELTKEEAMVISGMKQLSWLAVVRPMTDSGASRESEITAWLKEELPDCQLGYVGWF